ncbi:MAG: AMP-binding protein, partial [Desulfobacteraceae bacterium]
PWLKFYDRHVPPNLEYPEKTYLAYFREAVKSVPRKVAVYYMGRGMTFYELDRLSDKFACFLQRAGMQPGDTVGVHIPNLPAYYIAIIGICKAGCVLSGVSPLLQPKELEYQLNDSDARCLVTLDIFYEKVAAIREKTGVKTVVVTQISDFLPAAKKLLGKLLKKIPTASITPLPAKKVYRFRQILNDMPADKIGVRRNLQDAMLMQYTGGTTGLPKGALLTEKNICDHLKQIQVWLDLKAGDDTLLSAFPLFHLAGLALAMASMAMGYSQVAVPNPRDLDFIISAIKKYQPTGIVNVPTLFIELLKKPKFASLDFSTVSWFISGAAPFPADHIKKFETVVGEGKLIEVLGMTETSPVTTALPLYGKKKIGSVGIPFPDTEVKLVNPDTGELAPPGEPGEFVVRGPQVFTLGYHNNPEETAKTLKDGWIYTGDICKMDADGYFYVVDRLKDMVNVSGFNVFTRQVDEVLMEHPDIDMAATIGLPDPKRPGSEIVASAIVLKTGIEKSNQTEDQITAYMRTKVAPYKIPRLIKFMDELPTSPIGKVLKRELRKKMR